MLMTVREVCQQLRISKSTLYRWEKVGLVPFRINARGDRRYSEEAVQQFLSMDKKGKG